METTVSSNITIDITLVWTVIGALASVIGVLGTVVSFLYRSNQSMQKAHAETILSTTTQVLQVTRDNTEASKALIRSVDDLPSNLIRTLSNAKLLK